MGEKWVQENFRHPIAEHGLSMLVTAYYGGKVHSVLFDTGISSDGAVSNAHSMRTCLNREVWPLRMVMLGDIQNFQRKRI